MLAFLRLGLVCGLSAAEVCLLCYCLPLLADAYCVAPGLNSRC